MNGLLWMSFRERKAAKEYGKSWQMPFMEQVPFVYFKARFGDSAWKKVGISSVMRQLQKSRATGLRSTSFRTSSKLRSNTHALIVLRETIPARASYKPVSTGYHGGVSLLSGKPV